VRTTASAKIQPVHALPITDAMRDAAMQGLPLFSRGGRRGVASADALKRHIGERWGDWGRLSAALKLDILNLIRH
jgi:hypothetical protein